eukprot:9485878-Pyramimonas_sp.AAC.1
MPGEIDGSPKPISILGWQMAHLGVYRNGAIRACAVLLVRRRSCWVCDNFQGVQAAWPPRNSNARISGHRNFKRVFPGPADALIM